jgi:cell division protein FtsN
LAYDQDDYDGDGVIDWFDKCPQTPPGVEVDENGCPLDEDKDLVVNYKDDELGTPLGVPVTPKGVELTDEMILQQYLQYLDSAAQYQMAENVERIERKFNISEQFKAKSAVRFVVKVGGENGLTPEEMEKLLSIPDVSISTQDGKNYVTVGDYNNVPDAVKRKIKLTKQGINETEVVKKDNEGNLTSLGDETNNMMVDAGSTSSSNEDAEKVIYRVQIGAFSSNRPKGTFKGQDVLEFYTNDNLYKYVTGSSNTYQEAAANRDKLRAMGYEGAFVVAYKSGSRANLSELGVTSNVKNEIVNENVEDINPDLIDFKVQVGIYKNQLPTEVLEMFLSLEDISQTTLESGATRYTSGEFKSYAEAEKYKNSLVERGLTNAFIISSYEGQLISVDKAKKLKP